MNDRKANCEKGTMFTLAIRTVSERYVRIEVLDEAYSVDKVAELIGSNTLGGSEGVLDGPYGEGDAGVLTSGGHAVARYEVIDVIDDVEIEGMFNVGGSG